MPLSYGHDVPPDQDASPYQDPRTEEQKAAFKEEVAGLEPLWAKDPFADLPFEENAPQGVMFQQPALKASSWPPTLKDWVVAFRLIEERDLDVTDIRANPTDWKLVVGFLGQEVRTRLLGAEVVLAEEITEGTTYLFGAAGFGAPIFCAQPLVKGTQP